MKINMFLTFAAVAAVPKNSLWVSLEFFCCHRDHLMLGAARAVYWPRRFSPRSQVGLGQGPSLLWWRPRKALLIVEKCHLLIINNLLYFFSIFVRVGIISVRQIILNRTIIFLDCIKIITVLCRITIKYCK